MKSSHRMGVNARYALERSKTQRKHRVGSAVRWLFSHGWKWGALLLSVIALGFGITQAVLYVQWDRLATIKHVQIEGCNLLALENLLQISGVEIGQSMIGLHTDSIEQRIEKNELVKAAKVQRVFPSTVRIAVVETGPLFMSRGAKGLEIWSDKGTRMPIMGDLAFQLPLATIHDSRDVEGLVQILERMKEQDPMLYGKVSQILLSKGKEWAEVFFRDVSFKVLFATEQKDPLEFKHYRLLVQGMSREIANSKVLDFRFPGMAVTQPSKMERSNG